MGLQCKNARSWGLRLWGLKVSKIWVLGAAPWGFRLGALRVESLAMQPIEEFRAQS